MYTLLEKCKSNKLKCLIEALSHNIVAKCFLPKPLILQFKELGRQSTNYTYNDVLNLAVFDCNNPYRLHLKDKCKFSNIMLLEVNIVLNTTTEWMIWESENYLSTSGSTPRDISTSMIFFITAPCRHGCTDACFPGKCGWSSIVTCTHKVKCKAQLHNRVVQEEHVKIMLFSQRIMTYSFWCRPGK